jgi:hypothetical protein
MDPEWGQYVKRIATTYAKWPLSIPNGYKRYQKFPFKGITK